MSVYSENNSVISLTVRGRYMVYRLFTWYIGYFDIHGRHLVNFESYYYPKIPRKSTCSKDSDSVEFEEKY